MISIKVVFLRLTILNTMVRRFSFIVGACFVGLFISGVPAKVTFAASAIECHCFRDRSYSQTNPAAFDPYLLATVQNRLLAYTFAISRQEIVREKMSGTSGDHLWIAHWVARAAGRTKEDISAAYQELGTWRSVVKHVDADPEVLGHHFVKALDEQQTQLAIAVVEQVLDSSFAVPVEQQVRFLNEGATIKEMILSNILALMADADAMDVFRKARKNGDWGSVSMAAGVTLEGVDSFLARHFPETEAGRPANPE